MIEDACFNFVMNGSFPASYVLFVTRFTYCRKLVMPPLDFQEIEPLLTCTAIHTVQVRLARHHATCEWKHTSWLISRENNPTTFDKA
jgi:hypothetical protein